MVTDELGNLLYMFSHHKKKERNGLVRRRLDIWAPKSKKTSASEFQPTRTGKSGAIFLVTITVVIISREAIARQHVFIINMVNKDNITLTTVDLAAMMNVFVLTIIFCMIFYHNTIITIATFFFFLIHESLLTSCLVLFNFTARPLMFLFVSLSFLLFTF